MLPPSSLSVVVGNKEDGARGLGTHSFVDHSYKAPGCRGKWGNDCSQNPESWVSECAWLW